MPSLVVGITGLNATDNPGPGVGIARSLRLDSELDLVIVGLAYNALEPGIYMDWIVDTSFTLPYPSASAREYIARLWYIKETTGLDCVIPGLDAELPLFIRYAGELESMGIRTCLPTMNQFRLRAKDQLPQLARQSGLSAPKTLVVSDETELWSAIEEVGLPLYVKGIYYQAHRAATAAEAVGWYRRLLAEWGGPVIVQAIVQGDELNVVGLGDGEGGCLGLVCTRKTVVTPQGKMWSGVTVRHPGMLKAAERFVTAQRWRGPFELECIVHEDEVSLIEINPRFPAWVYFASAVGVNLPSRMIRQMYDMPCDVGSDYDVGQLFLRYSYDMVASTEQYQRLLTTGQLPARESALGQFSIGELP